MKVDLAERLPIWVDRGLLTEEQADALRRFERSDEERGGRTALIAEAFGYLGASLAVVAGGMVAAEHWERLTAGGRLTLTALMTVALLAAGWWIRDRDSAAIQRLVSLLWAGASAGTAFTAGLFATEVMDWGEVAVALTVSGAAGLVSLVLYLQRPRMLQHVALAASVVGLATSLLGSTDAVVEPGWYGLLVWGLGVAWVLLTWSGWLSPDTTGWVVGLAGVGIGAQVATFETSLWGLALALGSTVAVMVASVLSRRTLLLGFGAAGVFVFVPQAVFELFGDSLGAPVALFLTGLLLVVAALAIAKLKSEVIDEEAHDGR